MKNQEIKIAANKRLAQKQEALNRDLLTSVLSYSQESGDFTWLETRTRSAKKGSKAGHINSYGYVVIQLFGRGYMAHRLAWLYIHGAWPADQIDHINSDRNDNRIANLRECTQSENMMNIRPNSKNKSGFKGVHWHPKGRGWMAVIRVAGKKKYLGSHRTPELAYAAYCAAAIEAHGEFARLNN